jgi:hypothetical protein
MRVADDAGFVGRLVVRLLEQSFQFAGGTIEPVGLDATRH